VGGAEAWAFLLSLDRLLANDELQRVLFIGGELLQSLVVPVLRGVGRLEGLVVKRLVR